MSIEVRELTKTFGHNRALDHVSVDFHNERIYGLLGRNGAGKTTLLNCITGRIFPTGGDIRMDGARISENDAALGQIYMSSEQTMYPESMRVDEAFRHSRSFYPTFDGDSARAMADQFGLDLRRKIKHLSTGYASIFKLVVALNVGVPYLLLDEPVLGLDANHRDLFYKLLIEKYAERPCCMVISTHLIEEVSGIVEDVVIVDNGRILCSQSRDALLSGGYTVSGPAGLVDVFLAGKDCIGADILGGLKTAYVRGSIPGDVPDGLEISAMDLQKLFIQLTNS